MGGAVFMALGFGFGFGRERDKRLRALCHPRGQTLGDPFLDSGVAREKERSCMRVCVWGGGGGGEMAIIGADFWKSSSVPVHFGTQIWCAAAPFRFKVDEFVPHTQHVNLRTVGRPKSTPRASGGI